VEYYCEPLFVRGILEYTVDPLQLPSIEELFLEQPEIQPTQAQHMIRRLSHEIFYLKWGLRVFKQILGTLSKKMQIKICRRNKTYNGILVLDQG
jgi:predicted N-acyltransferase